MSSIPARRTTRVTRSAALNNENANARPSRTVAARTKPASKDAAGPATTRATGTTAASRAKVAAATKTVAPAAAAAPSEGKFDPAAGKRKRSALGEVTVANGKQKAAPLDKGKAKEAAPLQDKVERKVFDGVVLPTAKKVISTFTKTTTTVQTAVRPALTQRRSRTDVKEKTRPQRVEVLADVKEELEQEIEVQHGHYAMEIDAPAARAAPAPKVASRGTAARRAPARTVRRVEVDDLEEEEDRAPKKRRTSSEAGDEEQKEVEHDLNAFEEDPAMAAHHYEGDFRFGAVEADPNGDDWEDLDAEDVDDPQMVSEYVVEIFEYLKEVEQTTMANPNYMESQKELAWKMRGILIDWLIQVHFRFRLLPETLFLAVNIIDRFLSSRVVSLAKLQLVGISCMFVAAKVEEIVAPSASNFLYCADSSYTESEILQAERYILKTLDWNLSYPNPMHFLRRISKADEYNVQVRTIGKYLMEISCLEWRLIAAPPSLLAAAAIWLARMVIGREDWSANLAHYSSYRESELLPTANLMLNYVLKPIAHQSFYKKYASKKYMKASTYVRTWALDRWEEGARANLMAELPALKEQIRVANEYERQRAALAAEEEGVSPEELEGEA